MKTVTLDKRDIYRGNLILVNGKHGISGDVLQPGDMRLADVESSYSRILMERKSRTVLSNIFHTIHSGRNIVPVSGYRTSKEQRDLYDGSIRENGVDFTEKYVAKPGHSEHETGLAIDLALDREDIDFICPDFPYEGICNIFREEAVKYGFIQRYEKRKERITGIAHEPWHFRYVGYPHSIIMKRWDLSLEEYTEFVKEYAYGEKNYLFSDNDRAMEISYIPSEKNILRIELDDDSLYQVSGNNVDGYILTVWGRRCS